jgi:hypothetical protein
MRHMNQEMEVTVKVSKLIEALKKNKKIHIKEYKEAKKQYLVKVNEFIHNCLEDLDSGKLRSDEYKHRLHQPINNEDQYDQYIDMLDNAEEKEMKISKMQHDCFVHDKWDWMSGAKSVNSMYTG